MNELDHVVVGDNKTALAGDCGTAQAGHYDTALAGDYGTAQAGLGGTAQAGDGGVIVIRWLDDKTRTYRLRCAQVGEGGLKPDTPYRLDAQGNFVEADAHAEEEE